MVLSNAPTKVTRSATAVGFNGGSKKSGLPYQIGRSWRTSLAFGNSKPKSCCSLSMIQYTPNKNPKCSPHPPGRWMGGRRC